MKRTLLTVGSLLISITISTWGADNSRDWKSGTLVETEKEQVLTGNTRRTNRDSTVKDKGRKTEYSQTTTSKKTDDYDTFQIYTIEDDSRTYIARERLLFPWSKPASVSVGEKVKFVVQKNTMYLLDDEGKQHKAGISKVRMNRDAEQK
jgi:hypothetical protein